MPIYTDPFDVNSGGSVPLQERDFPVTAAVATGGALATLTVPTGHGIAVGNKMAVNISNALYNTAAGATVTVTQVTATTVSYALAQTIAQANVSGYITLWVSPPTVFSPWSYEGAVQQAVVTTAQVNGANVATITTAAAHGFRKGQVVEVNIATIPPVAPATYFNGIFTITAVTNTTFSYALTHAAAGPLTMVGYAWFDGASAGTAYQASIVDTQTPGQSATGAGDASRYSSNQGITTTSTGPAPVGSEKNETQFNQGNQYGGPVTDSTGVTGQAATTATTVPSTYSAAVNDFDTTIGGGYVPGQVVANPVYVAPKPAGVPATIVDTQRVGGSATSAGDTASYSSGLATPPVPSTATVSGNLDIPNIAQGAVTTATAAAAGIPGAPGTPTGVTGRGGVTVSFTAASAVANAPIRGYIVESATLGTLHVPAIAKDADIVNAQWATSGNTVTLTTAVGHTFLVGETVIVSGVTVNSGFFNGTFTVVAVPSPRTFTYTKAGGVVASTVTATGSVTDSSTPTVFFDYVTPDAAQPLKTDGTVNSNGWAGEKFRVAAYNINGQGPWSSYSAAVTAYNADEKDYTNPGGIYPENRTNPVYRPDGSVMKGTGGTPSFPVGVTVAGASATSQTVSWTAPTFGSVGITHYWVQRYDATGATAQGAAVDAGTSLNTTISGLTGGTSYRYTVQASTTGSTQPAANGEISAQTAAVSPPGVTNAPTIGTATAGTTTTATVTWTLPTLPTVPAGLITATKVYAYQGTTFIRSQAFGAAAITTGANGFTGLTPGQSYTFKVTASTLSGESAQSVASNSITSI